MIAYECKECGSYVYAGDPQFEEQVCTDCHNDIEGEGVE